MRKGQWSYRNIVKGRIMDVSEMKHKIVNVDIEFFQSTLEGIDLVCILHLYSSIICKCFEYTSSGAFLSGWFCTLVLFIALNSAGEWLS